VVVMTNRGGKTAVKERELSCGGWGGVKGKLSGTESRVSCSAVLTPGTEEYSGNLAPPSNTELHQV
jgi:hypothetical protein